MTDEEILAQLNDDNGRTIVVDNTWYFTGKTMQCCHSEEGNECCNEYYPTFEEAIKAIRYFSEGSQPKVL